MKIQNSKKSRRDFEKDDPMAEFLKLKQYIVIRPLEDRELLDKNAAQNIAEIFKEIKPFNDFLNRSLQ